MASDEPTDGPTLASRVTNLVVAGIVIATVIAVIVGVNNRSHKHTSSSKPTPGTASSASAQPTPTVKPTQSVSPAAARTQLLNKLTSFVRTYCLILPSDTATSRRIRTAPLASADAMQLLDFNIHETQAAKAIRQHDKQVVKGSVDTRPSQILIQPENSQGTLMYVYARVTVRLYKGYVSVGDFQPPFTSASLWRYTSGSWQLMSFSEGGN